MSVTSSDRDEMSSTERAVVFHVGLLGIFSDRAFGGNASWSRHVIMIWSALGPAILAWHIFAANSRKYEIGRAARVLWPLGLFAGYVIISCFNPSFRTITYENETRYIHEGARYAWLPSTATPDQSLGALWFFCGIYLSCINLLLIVRRRKGLRGLLFALSINTLVLAVFGTLQKLLGSSGLYFGLQPTPQPAFFASFIYHNHWGAHTVLITGAILALVFYFAARNERRDFFHSPAFGGAVAVLVVAASIPLSTSRSCTILVTLFLLIGLSHGIGLIRQRSKRGRSSSAPVVVALLLVMAVAAGAIYYLGKPIIEDRVSKTVSQLEHIRKSEKLDGRSALYRDTWAMAREQPAYGWGMGSYATVFQPMFNRQVSVDRLPLIYIDAHSDWLQSLAELGFVGTGLIALTALVPLMYAGLRHWRNPMVGYLLTGCGLVLMYAWLEFPFGNGSVVIAFWTCFFTAIQYGRLQARNQSVPFP